MTVSAMMLSALFLLPLCILSSGAGTGDASAHHDPGHVEGEAMEESGSSCGTVELEWACFVGDSVASCRERVDSSGRFADIARTCAGV